MIENKAKTLSMWKKMSKGKEDKFAQGVVYGIKKNMEDHQKEINEYEGSLGKCQRIMNEQIAQIRSHEKKLEQIKLCYLKVFKYYKQLKYQTPKTNLQLYFASSDGKKSIKHRYYLWRTLENKLKELKEITEK